MSEVEKMYENAGVNKIEIKRCSGIKQSICLHNCNECESFDYKYPPFTAEKQLELIKWLAIGGEVCRIDATEKGKWFVENDYKSSKCFVEFTEALANVINDLWQDLTEVEKTEIADILRG